MKRWLCLLLTAVLLFSAAVPIAAASDDRIIIDADGNRYEVDAGSEHIYSFYLNNGAKICSLEATTTWDAALGGSAGILIQDTPGFPIMGSGNLVVNTRSLSDGKVIYNYSNMNGAYFDSDDSTVITFCFKVADNAAPGVYSIMTAIKILAAENEERQIFNGVELVDFERKEGVLDGEEPISVKREYVADPLYNTVDFGENCDFSVSAKDGNNTETFKNFISVAVDGETIGEDYYFVSIDDDGALSLLLSAALINRLSASKHLVTFRFTDGSVNASLTVSDPSVGQTYSIGGGITNYLSETDEITVTLSGGGFEKTQITAGSRSAYSFSDVPAGDYTLSVAKANHVTRVYDVTIRDDVVLDVKICPIGDVTGDGKVTTMDFTKANSHARGVKLMEGYELQCGDVVKNDGEITTLDATRINSHAKGINKMW